MNKNQIAKKYSRSLINTVDVADIPEVIAEFKVFSKLIDTNRKLKILFAGQIFSEAEKETALMGLLSCLKASSHTEKYLKLIIMQGRLIAIKEIIKALTDAYNEKLKKVKALVISPVTMERNYIDRLRDVLKVLTQRDIEIESRLDSSLLGGFIVKVGSTIYDSSLKGQFQLLRAELTR